MSHPVTELERFQSPLSLSLPAAASVCAYGDFYSFVEPPFGMTPNTRFVFWGGSVSLALEQVMLGLRGGEGVMVITGGTGTGKTMLCRTLAHHLRQDALLSMVVNPTLDASDLLKQILDDFGVTPPAPPTGWTNYELFRTVEQFLVSRIPQGDRAVLLIDEAHHLTPPVLEQIRLLSNLESQSAKLLQVILIGRPDLDATLDRPELRELAQRVSRRCELLPLNAVEIRRYISHRLAVARASANTVDDPSPVEPVLDGSVRSQAPGDIFTEDALASIVTLSRGVPRVINLLCDRALEAGFAGQAHAIDAPHVLGAKATLRLNAAPAGRPANVRTLAIAAAAAAVVLAVAIPRSPDVLTARPLPAMTTTLAPVMPAPIHRRPVPAQRAATTAALAPPPAPAALPMDPVSRARLLAQLPDVRGLMRLHDEVTRRAARAGQLDSTDVQRVLEALESYTNDARALQLQNDARAFGGSRPR